LLLLSSILLTVSGGFLFGAGGCFLHGDLALISATVAFWVGRSFGQAILSEKGRAV
jgi:uncharacterized membrane protein YdjX (TVP38/TMEM64 family)